MGPQPLVDRIARREREAAASESTTDVERSTDPAEADAILDALDDAGCRSILRATSDAARSASEIAERCDLPRSTTYRKLDDLVAAGLLAERSRVRDVGRPPSEYVRRVETVAVSVGADGGLSVSVSPPPGAHRTNSGREPSEVE